MQALLGTDIKYLQKDTEKPQPPNDLNVLQCLLQRLRALNEFLTGKVDDLLTTYQTLCAPSADLESKQTADLDERTKAYVSFRLQPFLQASGRTDPPSSSDSGQTDQTVVVTTKSVGQKRNAKEAGLIDVEALSQEELKALIEEAAEPEEALTTHEQSLQSAFDSADLNGWF